ncbi:hypothetical protein [Wolbachia endosymbiont (group A) of Hedychridium roseum]|uniref:hypothetical protein n=1 Tax=Wolbachia endosymbiont (group A) of Hedychridium roseum TaxID=3077921 RepID=UPI00333E9427
MKKCFKDTIGNIEAPANAYENNNESSLEESIEHKYLEPCENSNESNTIAIEHIAASIEKLDNVGAALLVCGIVACILKMYAIAVIGGIVGLACIGFALYNSFKPNTKLEKVRDVEQPIIESSLNPI